ncbi:hypothetical protein CDAR_421811 [Caerostris darwini]|uniref:Uncharacterized protein n=1 Tax=Caerostris darwini TaxID=1538125 RepID=A0AAV4VBY9_9ARAC|nr:hypothetical protein CDAR_421811 [Caerostris darwini]
MHTQKTITRTTDGERNRFRKTKLSIVLQEGLEPEGLWLNGGRRQQSANEDGLEMLEYKRRRKHGGKRRNQIRTNNSKKKKILQ